MAKRYRALEKLEWPDGKGGHVVKNPGDEFEEPPERVGIAQLLKSKSVEVVK